MPWDERRQLTFDIANLAPPDLPGAQLLISGAKRPQMTTQEYPPDAISSWDARADACGADRLPPVSLKPIQMDCTFDLDSADPEILQQLRRYVDNCYIPHFVPKENCMVCEGLWSNGKVIACGNDECETRIHEECFGVVLRAQQDGPWLYPTCLLGRQLTCVVCMQSGGALKPLAAGTNSRDASDDQKWVHVLCALAIPELTMRDVPMLEPVDGFDAIENGRFRYLCGICRKRGGASVICEQENCNVRMHPLCAANAGFMIGTDARPLGAYCEKHLPAARVPGARRWISDEDLVDEIMCENAPELDNEPAPGDIYRYAFVLETTPGIHAHSKLLGSASALRWGPLPKPSGRSEIKSSLYENVVLHSTSWNAPGAVVVGARTRRPLMFPPQDHHRIGLPSFPIEERLIGAIIEFLPKDHDEWARARVLEWDSTRRQHLVQLLASNQRLWATVGTENALVLRLQDDDGHVDDGPRVKLYRPIRRGGLEWRPRPRMFGPVGTAMT